MEDTPLVELTHLVYAVFGALSGRHYRTTEGDLVTSSGPVTVRAYPGQVGIILGELARNAVQAGGRVRIEVGPVAFAKAQAAEQPQTDQEIPAGSYGRLLVSDNGHGIPSEVRARLFDPFFTTRAGAAGMGLALVYGIVKANCWYIDIRSTPDTGTDVEILIPVATERADTERRRPAGPSRE